MYFKIVKKLTEKAINLSRITKKSIAIFLDTIICIFSTWVALSLRLGELVLVNWEFIFHALLSVIIAIPVFFSWGLYKVIFRYVNGDTLQVLTKAITVYTILHIIIFSIVTVEGVPRSIGLMQPMIIFLMVGASRWLVKIWLNQYFPINPKKKFKKEVIIYGAGDSGRQLASNLLHSHEFKFLFFIDDNKSFWGGTIDGYHVKPPSSINNLMDQSIPRELWLAMPNLSAPKRRKLINFLQRLRLHVRTLPSFSDLTNRKVLLSDIRELNVNELIGREAIRPNSKLLKKCIHKKTVLVTGAGGSIGSEICRQILSNDPLFIILADNSELALYNIHSELNSIIQKHDNSSTTLVPLLINIQDENKLDHIFKTWKPHTVYHAAAYKHVPIVEHNIVAGIKNNVIGTLKCANIAMKYDVKYFVLVSTDKAVRPTNIMGASKRLAEMTLQLLSNDLSNNSTCFCMVRFGNVLGSSGSVVPLFRKQIESGGPVTVTDKNVTRYFMTIEEAAQLVIQAGSMSKGGEVFLLDMGKPIRILDLARRMIKAKGLIVKDQKTPWGDVEIKFQGLRPGEKLYEELLIGDSARQTKHSRILQARESFILKEDFQKLLKKLEIYFDNNNTKEIRNLLKRHIPGYSPNTENVDLISKYKEHNSLQ